MAASISRTARAHKFLGDTSLALASIFLAVLLFTPALASGPQSNAGEKKMENRPIRWDPPNIDKQLKFLTPGSSCVLTDVLKQAAIPAKKMEDNLSNFTAEEAIRYEFLGNANDPVVYKEGAFGYVAVLSPTSWGASIQETRTAMKGSETFPAIAWDRGLPGLALIFLPTLQTDYDMKCEGENKWNGQPVWVVDFQQRAHTTSHTWSYVGIYGGVHEAKLKGRAWLAVDSGNVVHLETTLLQSMPEVHVRNSWFSIDYAPVQFHSRDVRIWLPQAVDSYTQFDDMDGHRIIIYHNFSNFMLYSVEVKQEIKKPT